MSVDPSITVQVVWPHAPRQVSSVDLILPAGATLADALHASGLLDDLPDDAKASLAYSVWGQRRDTEALLRDQDRVEITRDLVVDPMNARRARQRAQGKPARRR